MKSTIDRNDICIITPLMILFGTVCFWVGANTPRIITEETTFAAFVLDSVVVLWFIGFPVLAGLVAYWNMGAYPAKEDE